MTNSFYCKGDTMYHYENELPKSLRPYVNYQFSSGGVVGEDFKSFCRKYKNAINHLLPAGYSIHRWTNGHYYCSAVIKAAKDRYLYISIGDVRYWQNEWFTNILCRTMAHESDWTGGHNQYASLFNLAEKLRTLAKSSQEV